MKTSLEDIKAAVELRGSIKVTLSPDEVEDIELLGLCVKEASFSSNKAGKRICIVTKGHELQPHD